MNIFLIFCFSHPLPFHHSPLSFRVHPVALFATITPTSLLRPFSAGTTEYDAGNIISEEAVSKQQASLSFQNPNSSSGVNVFDSEPDGLFYLEQGNTKIG